MTIRSRHGWEDLWRRLRDARIGFEELARLGGGCPAVRWAAAMDASRRAMVDVLATSANSVKYKATVPGAAGITANPRGFAHEVNSAQSDRYALRVFTAWAASTYSSARAASRSNDPASESLRGTGMG